MLILKNATTVEFKPARVRENIEIAIQDTEILAIVPNLTSRFLTPEIKQMNGFIVMPGIVYAHNHFYSGLSRGIMAQIPPCPYFISTLKIYGSDWTELWMKKRFTIVA